MVKQSIDPQLGGGSERESGEFRAQGRLGSSHWWGLSCLSLSLLLSVGCAGNIDRKSGGDAYRNQAQTLAVGKFVDDTLDHGSGDSTDWKSVEVAQPGKLVVSLTSDPGATLVLGVYDKYGVPQGEKTKKKGATDLIALTVKAKLTGLYFIRVRAKNGGPITYSVKVSFGDGGGGGGGTDLPDF